MKPRLRNCLSATVVGLFAITAQAQTGPTVQGAWARPTVQGQAAGGGYLDIVGGSVDDRLVSARSELARSVQLHTMSMEGNVMHMREVPGVDIPAGRTVQFKPGGYHLMFMGLKQPLEVGGHVPLVLHFEKAGDVKVEMPVMTQPMPAGHEMKMPMK